MVLIIDDEPTIRMLMAEVLEEAGYIVIEAGDGAGGLKILQSDIAHGHLDPGMDMIAKPFVMAAFANKVAEMIEV